MEQHQISHRSNYAILEQTTHFNLHMGPGMYMPMFIHRTHSFPHIVFHLFHPHLHCTRVFWFVSFVGCQKIWARCSTLHVRDFLIEFKGIYTLLVPGGSGRSWARYLESRHKLLLYKALPISNNKKALKKRRKKNPKPNIKEVKIFPELFKIGGCREEKSELRIWDATVTTQGKKMPVKIPALFKDMHLLKCLGKTGCHIILTNKNMLCQPHAAPQTFWRPK